MKYVIGNLTRFANDPASFAVAVYNDDDKKMILDYMRNIADPCGVGGYIDDCKTGEVVKETNSFYEDDEYVWSKQDIYHIDKYDAAVEPSFIDHVRNRIKKHGIKKIEQQTQAKTAVIVF